MFSALANGWSSTSATLHPETANQTAWSCYVNAVRQHAIENIPAKNGGEQREEVNEEVIRNLKYLIM